MIREEILLEKCINRLEQLLPNSSHFLNNSLCVKDTEDAKIKSSVLDVENFEGIFIAIEECQSNCASQSEIKNYMENNIFYFFN